VTRGAATLAGALVAATTALAADPFGANDDQRTREVIRRTLEFLRERRKP
jgi:hypothetical protein